MKRFLIGLVLPLLIGCNDRSIPTHADAIPSLDSLSIEPSTVEVEEQSSISLVAWAYARGSKVEASFPIAWETTNETIAQVSLSGTLEGMQPGSAKVRARYQGLEAEAPVWVKPIRVADVDVTPTVSTLKTGASRTLIAIAQDTDGNALQGRNFLWSSSAPDVASVDQSGLVTGKGRGTASITARTGSASGTATVVVSLAEVARIEITCPDCSAGDDVWEMYRGDQRALHVHGWDAHGNPVGGLEAQWSTGDPMVANVDRSGILRAVGEGETVITATFADSLTASHTVRVEEPEEILISDVSPNPLPNGGSATIRGVGFHPTPSANKVRLGSQDVEVVSGGPTQLTIQVPDFSIDACGEPVNMLLVVQTETDGGVRRGQVPVQVGGGGEIDLSVGEAQSVPSPECVNIHAQPGTYLLTVYNTNTSPTNSTGFTVRATTADGAPAQVSSHRTFSPSLGIALQGEDHGLHGSILEQNSEIAARMPQAGRPQGAAPQKVAQAPSVGDVIDLHVPDIKSLCTPYATVSARVVYSGSHGIVLEDPQNPGAGTMDATLRSLGEEFDNVMWSVLRTNFGDPLAYDSRLDNNGRLYMLFTHKVRDMGAGKIAGFVTSADFSSASSCSSSDEAEVFYAFSPETSGDTESWHRSIRSTVIHEVKHLVSYAERYAASSGNPDLEDRWLEEATAMTAEEIWARTVFGYGPRANVGYQSSLGCELGSQQAGACQGKPKVMLDHFYFLYQYLNGVESHSPLGQAAGDSDYSFYGSGWQFVRWLIDQYATSEAGFLSAITQTSRKGTTNIAHIAGASFEDLLGHFMLAQAVDDYPGMTASDPRHTLPSWNTRDIFQGLHNHYRGSENTFDEPFPLVPRRATFGAFEISVPGVRGGSAAFIEISGSTATDMALDFSAAGGGAMASSLKIAVIRVQ